MLNSCIIPTYKQYACTLIRSLSCFNKIDDTLKSELNIIKCNHIRECIQIIKSTPISVFIFDFERKRVNDLQYLEIVKTNLTNLKTIALMVEEDLELVRLCGKHGVDKVLLCSGNQSFTRELVEEISNVLNPVSLKDLNIEEDSYNSSKIVAKACHLIEHHYLTLKGVSEVADILNINECTLSREFKKQQIINPKKLLMMFKVKHASQLVTQADLSIKEIAQVSGFSSSQHFNNCYKAIYGVNPSSMRLSALA
ncbi:helix-turn-helix transcriptional regulator [Fulvivirga sp. 29W222]|uniref:Helix-turn-helix transcriptional regulator n=1 Tax=Fulvivirga marina TaxID=2494733 RepID=A0A937KDA2_9BACT|nr:AraC family transcriptional regulator [Fulvivirga marina]MBL6448397.1 helix-turn-helix transcriptional regulator [Fulvivirga marina]